MISSAFAQAVSSEKYSFSVWDNPTLWVAISFLIFIAIFARPAWRFITSTLDNKISEITDKIEEATKLREEAQDMLAAHKRKIAEAEKETAEIIAEAREEAHALRARLTIELEASLKRREKIAADRIAQAEMDAVEEVRALTANIALGAARELLAEAVKDETGESLVASAIKELPDKLTSKFTNAN